MSTMVTGGLGYVGRHLVARLAERGETVVSYNRDYAEGTEENVVYVQGELYDLPRFVDTLCRHDVGRIVHTAAMSHPDLSVDLPITTFTANVDAPNFGIPLAQIEQLSAVAPGTYKNGAAFTFIAVGDPTEDQIVGGQFNLRYFHYLGVPNDPVIGTYK